MYQAFKWLKKNLTEVCTYQTAKTWENRERKLSDSSVESEPISLCVAFKLSVCYPYCQLSGDSVVVRFVNSKTKTTAIPVNQYAAQNGKLRL